jgi:hypothetical protein
VLEIVNILGDLGVRDARMQEALNLVASKQGKDGRWLLENTYNGRYQVNIEAKDKPSKWITYRSLILLCHKKQKGVKMFAWLENF